MSDQDSICLLSSDEDEPQIKKKKVSPISIKCKKSDAECDIISEPIICLDSDEETDSQEVVVVNKENLETNTMPVTTTSQQDADQNGSTKKKYVNNSSIDTLKKGKSVTGELENINSVNDKKKILNGLQGEEKHGENSSNDVDNLLMNTESLPVEAITFMSTCKNQINGTESAHIIYKKFPTLIKMFKNLSDEISKSDYCKNFLTKQNKIASESVKGSIISFKDVYQYFKSILDCDGIRLSKKDREHVRKLEAVMNKLLEKLKELNEAEVDFDAEDDSAYIKHDRYSQRLSKVYKKYCQILKKNPYAGRFTHERLDFVSSHYNEINLAISKKYKNNMTFPNYSELASFISDVVKKTDLVMSEAELKLESEHCFRKLGDLLQMRRKKELYEVHCGFIIENEDPAEKDKELDTKLRISSKEGMVKIEQVCEEFVKKQELGVNDEEIDCSSANDDDDEDEEDVEKAEDEELSKNVEKD